MKQAIRLILIFLILFGLLLPTTSYAAKPRVRKSTTSVKKTTGVAGISYSSAKLARPNIVISFFNLDKVTQIDYVLSYTAGNLEQGAGGSVRFSGSATDSRTLYFGTCSAGKCVPHTNIKNAQLLVTTKLKSGGSHSKLYRIKY